MWPCSGSLRTAEMEVMETPRRQHKTGGNTICRDRRCQDRPQSRFPSLPRTPWDHPDRFDPERFHGRGARRRRVSPICRSAAVRAPASARSSRRRRFRSFSPFRHHGAGLSAETRPSARHRSFASRRPHDGIRMLLERGGAVLTAAPHQKERRGRKAAPFLFCPTKS